MSARPFRTALVGLGRMGAGYADDPVMARHYPYATHAQVLRGHPRFAWAAAVDPAEGARSAARGRWGVPLVAAGAADLPPDAGVEVAVIATPPEARLGIVEALPDLRAVIVEKPLGGPEAARAFLDSCARRGILVQVNLWRRADPGFRDLAAGGLRARVGAVQAGFGLYGNGLRNNGTHLVDFVRMLLGEVEAVEALGPAVSPAHLPLAGDVELPFALWVRGGPLVACQPLDFTRYREVGLDLWGTEGRLSILQEGLVPLRFPKVPNRAMSGEGEVASDAPEPVPSTVGVALRHLYDDLARALDGGAEPVSPAGSALRTEAAVEAVVASAAGGGRRVRLDP